METYAKHFCILKEVKKRPVNRYFHTSWWMVRDRDHQ